MQKKHATLMTLAGASIALLALAGCSPAQSGDAAKDSKPTASADQKSDSAKGADEVATDDEPFVPEEKTFECVDGYASMSDSNAILSLEGDCAAVEVTGVNSLISINGNVDSLSVGGSINKVVTISSTNITFLDESSGNIVETSGEPTVTDNGVENEIVAPE